MAGADFTVSVQVPELEEVQRRMKGIEDNAPAAIRNAINKTITQAKKLMSDEARREYIVKAGEVKKTIRVQKARLPDLTGSAIASSEDRLKLYKFRVSPTKPRPASPPSFYRSQVKQATRLRELTGSNDRSSAFVARMPSGHTGMFQRQKGTKMNSGRGEKIAELTSLSIPGMIGSRLLRDGIMDKAQEFMNRMLDAEIQRMLEAKL